MVLATAGMRMLTSLLLLLSVSISLVRTSVAYLSSSSREPQQKHREHSRIASWVFFIDSVNWNLKASGESLSFSWRHSRIYINAIINMGVEHDDLLDERLSYQWSEA